MDEAQKQAIYNAAADEMVDALVTTRKHINEMFEILDIELDPVSFILGNLWVTYSILGIELKQAVRENPDFFKRTVERLKEAG